MILKKYHKNCHRNSPTKFSVKRYNYLTELISYSGNTVVRKNRSILRSQFIVKKCHDSFFMQFLKIAGFPTRSIAKYCNFFFIASHAASGGHNPRN